MVLAGTISPTPFTTVLVGLTVKAAPEQIVAVLAAISGVGLTVTVRSKAAPVQVPLLGVSV